MKALEIVGVTLVSGSLNHAWTNASYASSSSVRSSWLSSGRRAS